MIPLKIIFFVTLGFLLGPVVPKIAKFLYNHKLITKEELGGKTSKLTKILGFSFLTVIMVGFILLFILI